MSDLSATTSKNKMDSPEESIQKRPRTSTDDNLDEISFTYPINSVISNCKVTRTPCEKNSWGCLQFYENSKLVFAQDLWSNEIEVNGKNLLQLNESLPKIDDSNFLMNYWDWAHIIDSGFWLSKKKENTVGIKINGSMDEHSQFKFFAGDNEIVAKKGKYYEIFNGTHMSKHIDKVNSIRSAYQSKKYCYVIIGIYGKFMRNLGLFFDFTKISKDMTTSLPYWLLLKINREFIYLDNKVKSFLNKM